MPRYMVILQTTEEGVWTKFFDDRWAAEEYAQTGEMALNAVTELYERTNGCYECIRCTTRRSRAVATAQICTP